MGKVYLVGAGTGDPELLTVKAARLLGSADVVLHDSLVSDEVLKLIPSTARIIHVGKRCGRKLLSQCEINSLLAHSAATARIVVRLKSGDPLVFGRGGEEMEELSKAGIDFEIVPGITAALAAAASARVSLTDRRCASSVLLTTAHRDGAIGLPRDLLLTANTTVVVHMPGSDYGALSESLRDAGLSAGTPCLVISCIGSPHEQSYRTTLASLPAAPRLPAPALLLVGRVVQRDELGASLAGGVSAEHAATHSVDDAGIGSEIIR